MHVQPSPMSTPSNDLEAMLDTPPQDDASRDARIEEFEASLADAFARSSDEENPEEPIDLGVLEQSVDVDDNEVAHDAGGTTTPNPTETYIAMASQATSFPAEASPSKPVDDSERRVPPTVTVLTTATETRNARNSSVHERSDATIPAPLPQTEIVHSAPTRNEREAPASTRPPMSDENRPPASPVAVERAQGLERAESVRGNAEPGAAARLAPVAAEQVASSGTDSKRQTASRDRNPSPRAVAAASIPDDTIHESTPRSNDRTQPHSSRSEADIEWTSHAARPADDPSLSRERPLPQAATNSVPNTVQPAVEVDLATNGVQRSVLNAEPTPQMVPRQPVEALPRQVEMLATRGGGTARMRLHPAQLGEVDITISIRGDVVDVIIHAEEPAARAAVMAHREQLAEALGARELRMEGFDVNGGGRDSGGENKQAAWSGAENRRDQFARPNELNTSDTEKNEIVDRAARAASTNERQRIDLRI